MERNKKVLVVGDIMVDRYTYVKSDRVAPEAPIPVWDYVKHEDRPGGAANVAHNMAAMAKDAGDIEVYLAGAGVGTAMRSTLYSLGVNTLACVGGNTMCKERYVDSRTMKYVMRFDNMLSFGSDSVNELKETLFKMKGMEWDAVVFSDYDKGTIDSEVVGMVSRNAGMTVVDSKKIDLSIYRGMDVLKINEHEYSNQVSKSPYTNVESLFRYVVVTKGKNGAQLRQRVDSVYDSGRKEHIQQSDARYIVNSEEFPTISVNAVDVTGCGDTHTAAMTFSLLKKSDIRAAVKFANECSRRVVQKFGTSVVGR